MTTDEALARLRRDWHLARGINFRTDEPGWSVSYAPNGEGLWELGWGKTVVEAIEAAEIKAAEEEREEAERRADYERRRAAVQLTLLERTAAFIPTAWEAEARNFGDAVAIPKFANLVNRSFEDEVKA